MHKEPCLLNHRLLEDLGGPTIVQPACPLDIFGFSIKHLSIVGTHCFVGAVQLSTGYSQSNSLARAGGCRQLPGNKQEACVAESNAIHSKLIRLLVEILQSSSFPD